MKTRVMLLLTVLGLGIGIPRVSAQQIPLFSQYYYNPFLYNPAAAGRLDYGEAFAIGRKQWTGIPDAPQTQAFTVDGPLRNEKIGLGFSAYDDQTSIFERIGAAVSYSYRLNFGEQHHLNLGVSLGMMDNRIDFNKVIVKDANDPVIGSQYYRRTTFDVTFGVQYTYHNFELGLVVPHLTTPVHYFSTNNSTSYYYSVATHIIGNIKYKFMFSDDHFKLEPMLHVQYVPGAPVELDAGATLTYMEKVWLGVMYRQDVAITPYAGVKFNNRLMLGYAYDVVSSKISKYSNGTHEVMLGFMFGQPKKSKFEEEILDRLDKAEKKIDKQEKKTDSLSNEEKGTKVKADSTSKKVKQIEDKLKDFDQFKHDMMDTLKKEQEERNGAGRGVKEGSKYSLNNIYFVKTNAELLPSSYDELKGLADILMKNPDMQIQVEGYADARGTTKYNNRLSRNRAESVKRYLMSHGVNAKQVVVKGKGETKPVGDNKTEDGRKMNRRVEMTILKK